MKRNKVIVLLILFIWFVISFVTNILGPILPMVIADFELNLTLAAFLPFSFFMAYGVMSIPAGLLVERHGAKRSLIAAFGLNFSGALLFVLFPAYHVVLLSLFIIGLGMAMLQVIILPLMREAGGEREYAFNSVLAQIVFGGASFVSPFVLKEVIRSLSISGDSPQVFWRGLIREDLAWSAMYLLFTVVFAAMLVVVSCVRFPEVKLKDEERAGKLDDYRNLLKNRQVVMFFLGIIAYVGTEQGLANWMSEFLRQYHGFDPETEGAAAVALFWGLMTLGCLSGLVIVRLVDSQVMLRVFTLAALLSLSAALFAPAPASRVAFPVCGFAVSVAFSIIFSLALNSVEKFHGAFSGILCTGIFGGALVPLVIGWAGDMINLRVAMMFLFITLLYILGLSYWARPLVKNQTVSVKVLLKK